MRVETNSPEETFDLGRRMGADAKPVSYTHLKWRYSSGSSTLTSQPAQMAAV